MKRVRPEVLNDIELWKQKQTDKVQDYRKLGLVDQKSSLVPSSKTLLAFSLDDLNKGWNEKALIDAVKELKPKNVNQESKDTIRMLFETNLRIQKDFFDLVHRTSIVLHEKKRPITNWQEKDICVSKFIIRDTVLGIIEIQDNDGETYFLCEHPVLKVFKNYHEKDIIKISFLENENEKFIINAALKN